MYNRALRVHKSIYEAFMRLAWIEFIHWIEKMRPEAAQAVNTLLVEIVEVGPDESQWNNLLEDQEVQTVWKQSLHHPRHDNGELSSF